MGGVYNLVNLQLYHYAGNNPVKYIDPDGRVPFLVVTAAIGAVVGGVAGGIIGGVKSYNETGKVDWKQVGVGAAIGAGTGAVVGATLGAATAYVATGSATASTSAVAASISGTAAAEVTTAGAAGTKMPNIGSKLEYVFGKATGNIHNIKRSQEMLRSLEKIGIYDNEVGRTYFQNALIESFYNGPGVVQANGRIAKDFLLMGPNGGVKVQAVWEGTKLITVNIY
ncbi:hypothetical protein WKV44_10410 [Spirochaetia bacterium 38H-sp]|uniref:RHS repeat-associated core domain-containing protein n=1 Tax=Rarispira pelagica TaxID=3141764 RepID=A0ABU9UE73_9SPIR